MTPAAVASKKVASAPKATPPSPKAAAPLATKSKPPVAEPKVEAEPEKQESSEKTMTAA